jgi:hypothetical protein
MTEQEWLECNDPRPMQGVLDQMSERKQRLFAVACCRRVWQFLPKASLAPLSVIEQFADGAATRIELEAAEKAAGEATKATLTAESVAVFCAADSSVCNAVWSTAEASAGRDPLYDLSGRNDQDENSYADELEAQASLIHEICGLLHFRPISIHPSWLNPTVSNLAHAAYEERIMPSGELEPDRLAVLSDALEEAGCDDADILDHLRGPGPHVRGCWALDLVLGKS